MATSPPHHPGRPPARQVPEHIHRRRWAILSVLLFSLLVVVLDNSILNVAMKTIAPPAPTGLGASQSELEWAINSYTLVFAGLLFTAGLLGDRLGRKKVLLFGMVVFGAGSVLAAFAGSPGQLIAFRAVMGLGGAFVMPATLAILMNVFERDEQPRAIGMLGRRRGPGHRDRPDHRRPAARALLVGLGLPGQRAHRADRADRDADPACPTPRTPGPAGSTRSACCCPSPAWSCWSTASSRAASSPTSPTPRCWARSLGGLAVLAVLRLHQKRSDHPALDVGYFSKPAFSAAVAAIALVFFALMGVTFFIVFYIQSVRGYSALPVRPAAPPAGRRPDDLRAAGPAASSTGSAPARCAPAAWR